MSVARERLWAGWAGKATGGRTFWFVLGLRLLLATLQRGARKLTEIHARLQLLRGSLLRLARCCRRRRCLRGIGFRLTIITQIVERGLRLRYLHPVCSGRLLRVGLQVRLVPLDRHLAMGAPAAERGPTARCAGASAFALNFHPAAVRQ